MPALVIVEYESEPTDACVRVCVCMCVYVCVCLRVRNSDQAYTDISPMPRLALHVSLSLSLCQSPFISPSLSLSSAPSFPTELLGAMSGHTEKQHRTHLHSDGGVSRAHLFSKPFSFPKSLIPLAISGNLLNDTSSQKVLQVTPP